MNKISRSNRKESLLERAWQPRDGSNVTYLHTSGAAVQLNQRLLARLEAENAQLRGSVVGSLPPDSGVARWFDKPQ
jgi:hypothetical protein